jgi:uncharacterized protein (DUF608 family)
MQSPSSPKIIDLLEHPYMNHVNTYFDEFFYDNIDMVNDFVHKLNELSNEEIQELVSLAQPHLQEDLASFIDISVTNFEELEQEYGHLFVYT